MDGRRIEWRLENVHETYSREGQANQTQPYGQGGHRRYVNQLLKEQSLFGRGEYFQSVFDQHLECQVNIVHFATQN